MIETIMDKLATFTSLFDFGPVISMMKSAGYLYGVCRASIYLIFICTIIGVVENFLRNGSDFKLSDNTQLLLKMILMGVILGSSTVYGSMADTLFNGLSGAGNAFMEPSIVEFRMNFRYLLSKVASHSSGPINIFDPVFSTATAEIMMVSGAYYAMLLCFYALVSYPSILIVIAFMLGPIVIPFSQISIFRGMFTKWLKLTFATCLFSFFVGIALMALNRVSFISYLAETTGPGVLLSTLILLIVAVLFLAFLPACVGVIFGVPIFNVFAYIVAAGSALFGLLPVAAKLYLVTRRLGKISKT